MTAPAPLATLTPEEELHWLALRQVPGLGAKRAGALLERLRTPLAIFRCSPSELEAHGLSPSLARSIASGCAFDEAVSQQELLRRTGTALLTFQDARYPEQLGEIYDPPVMLFARGCLELLQTPMLAVVGTRRPSTYGIAATERLSADLAQAGLTIVSGLARGIDTAAHRAVLRVGGNTVAVLGCGVDVVYPTENRALLEEVAAKGLLLSEYSMGTPSYPQNFPVRNRIVSGLSSGVLVMEGAQYSGSGITARLALDQGRDVFAVPGNITSKMSWGPNLLIKQGAKLVQEWSDVVCELPVEHRRWLSERTQQQLGLAVPDSQEEGNSVPPPLQVVAQQVLKLLRPDVPTHLDEIVDKLDTCSPSELIAALFELELNGMVRQLVGKNFVTVW